MNYIEQAINDVKVLQLLEENQINLGSTFRVKQLGENITHSGSIFMRLCRIGVLRIARKEKEKITVNFQKEMYRDEETKAIYENRWDAPTLTIRHRLKAFMIPQAREIETEYNVYEMIKSREQFALESYSYVMKQCKEDIFNKMAKVQEQINEIYEGYYHVQGLSDSLDWEIRTREWKAKKNN